MNEEKNVNQAQNSEQKELTPEEKALKEKIEVCQKEIEESLKKHGLELRVLNQILIVPPQPKQ